MPPLDNILLPESLTAIRGRAISLSTAIEALTNNPNQHKRKQGLKFNQRLTSLAKSAKNAAYPASHPDSENTSETSDSRSRSSSDKGQDAITRSDEYNKVWVRRPIYDRHADGLKRVLECLKSEIKTSSLTSEKVTKFGLNECEKIFVDRVLQSIHRNEEYPLLRMQIKRWIRTSRDKDGAITDENSILKGAKELAGS